MKSHQHLLGALFLALVLSSVAHAQTATAQPAQPDPNLARNLAATCANCHGTNGKGQGAMVALAGYSREAMVATMKDFKDGKRPATIMHQLSKGYTDAQIALIADYFAQQKKN
jgi:cytochrome subunit of sulfide dehydrogenase